VKSGRSTWLLRTGKVEETGNGSRVFCKKILRLVFRGVVATVATAVQPCVEAAQTIITMTIGSLLSREQIIDSMQSKDRWESIIELLDQLVAAGCVPPANRDQVLADLRTREESMSTGIGFGVAIPHTSSSHVNQVVAAFGRSVEGIEFDALDGKPVHFVVLFVVPANEFQTHLKTLAAIAKFLNDKKVRDALAVAPDTTSILEILGNQKARSL